MDVLVGESWTRSNASGALHKLPKNVVENVTHSSTELDQTSTDGIRKFVLQIDLKNPVIEAGEIIAIEQVFSVHEPPRQVAKVETSKCVHAIGITAQVE